MSKLIIQDRTELTIHLQTEKDPSTKVRLIALNLIATHDIGVTQACQMTGTPRRTLYDWINRWNTLGYAGIINKPPSKGKPPRLGEEDLLL